MPIMAAGNLISRFSFNLQPPLVFLSRLKKSEVRCFAANASDPRFPVRYVPNKRADAKQTQGSTSGDGDAEDVGMPTSSDSRRHGFNSLGKPSNIRNQKSSARLSGNSNNGFNHNIEIQQVRIRPFEEAADELQTRQGSFQGQLLPCSQQISYASRTPGSEYIEVPKEILEELQIYHNGGQGQWSEVNQEISCYDGATDSEYMEASEEIVEEIRISEGGGQGKQGRLKACPTRQDAQKLAVELLAKRAFTAMELRKKLISKHFPLNIVQVVIHDFLERGLINDQLYAETFSQSRWTSSSWGPRRIKHALLKKGVSEADVEEAVKLVFEDEEGSARNKNTKLSSSSMEQLYMQASKQWQRSQNVPYETRKARVIRWLKYRGFDWGVVGIILKKLESGHPP